MLQTAWQYLTNWGKAIWGFWLRMLKTYGWKKVSLAIGGLVVVIVGVHFVLSRPGTSATIDNTPQVSVESVAQLSSQSSPLSIVGTVTSLSEATVLSQSAGAVTAVNYQLGDYVPAGVVVAELEDASQRAALLQAQGSLDAAEANLANTQGPTGTSAKTSAVNALLGAYGAFDSAIRGTADTMFTNPNTATPQFFISSSDSQLPITLGNERLAIGPMWARETARASTLSVNDDLNAELTTTLSEVRQARSFFDTILAALNSAIQTQSVSQTTINADIVAATAARTSLTGALSALNAAQASLQSGGGATGSPNVDAAQAQVKEAQGLVAAARANVEKSIIRAPISGTINSFSLKLGDFVQQNSSVLTVANNGALEIVAYITQQDATAISVGDQVTIEGNNKGVVTRVAPAIDPLTKKIEVRIGVSSGASLTNGQSVIVDLPRKVPVATKTAPAQITIPITALKVGATETDVFTVASSTLVAHPVVIGELLGDRVVIAQGLTPDMEIVTDARGLRDGEKVEVTQ